MRPVLFACAIVGYVTCGVGAFAEDSIGQIKDTHGEVAIERSGHTIPGKAGDKIFQGDSVTSSTSDGAFGITFVDETMMSAGPGSVLVIQDYNFDTTTHEGRFNALLRRGTLVVTTGQMTKQSAGAMKIRTPVGSVIARSGRFLVRAGGNP